MIGRDAELEALQDAFKRLFVDRRLAAVTVVAEAGIGKSRLLYEFAAWSDARPERFFLFRGRATPQTQGQPFGLLRDIIAWRFQIADDDSIEAARRKMEQGIVPLFLDDDGPDLAEGHAHLLGHLIGIEWRESRHVKGILDDPKQIRNRAFHAAAQLFRRIGRADGIARRPAARRPALGRRREPRLPRLPGGGRPRRAAADAGLLPADPVRAPGELVRGAASTGGSTCNRSART